MNRRNFLTGIAGILAAGMAPAVLPSGIIMPVRQLWVPDWPSWRIGMEPGGLWYNFATVWDAEGTRREYRDGILVREIFHELDMTAMTGHKTGSVFVRTSFEAKARPAPDKR